MAEQQTETIWRDRKHFMWWPLSFRVYEIRNDRLYQKKGVLSTTLDELLLYRIVDLSLRRTFAQRIFGTGTIVLTTRGDSSPVIELENIAHPQRVRELISKEVERSRIHYNVVGREFYGRNAPDHAPGEGPFDPDLPGHGPDHGE